MDNVPSLKLNTGHMIPQISFGTFDAPPEQVTQAVELAIETGYRHIDCAKIYGNEEEVGKGIANAMKKLNLKREDLFITTKLFCDDHDPSVVRSACETSIKKLGVGYLDLYLIHFPVPFHIKEGCEFDINDANTMVTEQRCLEDTWKAMLELVPAGLVKSVGVSNFSITQIERMIKATNVVPAANQVEVNLHWLNTELIEFCHSKGIVVEAYSPFGSPGFFKGKNPSLFTLPAVVEIAKKHGKTSAQVLLRHAIQRGLVVISKSVTPERVKTNGLIFDFELSKEDMDKLNSCGMNKKLARMPGLVGHPEYPF